MSSSTTIGSLALGIQIIDVVAQSDHPLRFSDIQEQTGISKSNLYKYLNTLIQLDLLYRDQKTGSYSLGYKFLEYGNAVMQNDDFIERLTPYFKELSNLTNMTTLLSLWVNDSPVITNIWNTNFGLSIGAQVGTKLPINSSTGKIFAAYANSLEITNWIEAQQNELANFDVAAFQRELKGIRKNGFSFAHEPLVRHVSSIGLPILNYKNELVGAITVVGFEEDVPTDTSSEMMQQIIDMSKEMSTVYGFKEKGN